MCESKSCQNKTRSNNYLQELLVYNSQCDAVKSHRIEIR